MDKLKLNNEIVLCRKDVKIARVFLIRRLTQRLKRLKDAKGAAADKKKRKAERVVEEIKLLKHVSVDEVTKLALEKNLTELSAMVDSSLVNSKEHITASLAKHQVVQSRVNKIKKQYPESVNDISELLKTLGSRSAAEKKKKKKGGSKSKDSQPKVVQKKEIKLKKEEIVNEKINLEEEEAEKKEDDSPGKSKTKKEVIKAAGTEQKKTKNSSKKMKKADRSSSEDEAPSIPEAKPEPKKIIDPFFVNKTVIAPKLLVDEEEDDDGNDDDSMYRRFSERQRRPQRTEEVIPWKRPSNSWKMNNKQGEEKNPWQRPSNTWKTNYKQGEERNREKLKYFAKGKEPARPSLDKAESSKTDLHPSWAAKKVKLIQPFQGKKITFSE